MLDATLCSVMMCCCSVMLSIVCFGLVVVQRRNASMRRGRQARASEARSVGTRHEQCDANELVDEPASSKEERLLRKIQQLSKSLVDVLRTENDPIARAVVQAYVSSRLMNMPNARTVAHFNAGCIRYNALQPEYMYNDGKLKAIICHEMAHAWGEGHDSEWLRAWVYILRIATDRLHWRPVLSSNACSEYKLCNRSDCPRCMWT